MTTYPATDITPGVASDAPRGARRSSTLGSVRKLWSTRGGRIVLAAAAAIVTVAFTLSRRESAAEDAATKQTLGTPLVDDPFAAYGSNVAAQPIPSTGFNFQTYNPVNPADPPTSDLPNPTTIVDPPLPTSPPPPTTVIVQLPPTTPASPTIDPGGVGGSGSGSPGGGTPTPGPPTSNPSTPARKPMGYYRSSKDGQITYINDAGAASYPGLTAAQRQGVAGVEQKVAKTKKTQTFTINGRGHTMELNYAFHPTAYTGG